MAKIKETAIEIQEIKMGRIRCNVVGTTPLIMHRFSSKARRELLLPSPKKNRAEKAETLKHDPVGEFRECLYLNRSESEPALIHLPSNAFAQALAAAALDIPGATKSQIARLTSITSTQINLFGIPKLYMEMVRSSDMARTPDVRSRPIFPEWACSVEIQFVSSIVKERQIANLLAAAGVIVGLGDWRSQKGGQHGQFRIADDKDADFLRIVAEGAREAQIAAVQAAEPINADTEELLAWYRTEVAMREKIVPSDIADTIAAMPPAAKPKTNGKYHPEA